MDINGLLAAFIAMGRNTLNATRTPFQMGSPYYSHRAQIQFFPQNESYMILSYSSAGPFPELCLQFS